MPIKNTLKSKISYRIKRSKDSVFVRKDFENIGGYDQVGRILKGLVADNQLTKIGLGAYVKLRKSDITGNYIPEKPITALAQELLKKVGVKVIPTLEQEAYLSGESLQVPLGRVIGVDSRVSRKLVYNNRSVSFEKVSAI